LLDVISDRTRFDLLTNSELRLCPDRAVSDDERTADRITVEAGNPVDVSQDTCAGVQESKF